MRCLQKENRGRFRNIKYKRTIKKFVEAPVFRKQESWNRRKKCNRNGEKKIFEESELKKINDFKLKGYIEFQKEKENPTLTHTRMKFKKITLKEKILKKSTLQKSTSTANEEE